MFKILEGKFKYFKIIKIKKKVTIIDVQDT